MPARIRRTFPLVIVALVALVCALGETATARAGGQRRLPT